MKYLCIILGLFWTNIAFAQEGKEPVDMANTTVIEGTLLQVSKLPSPKGNAYPDCYYTAVIDISSIASGKSIPNRIILVIPGFFSRKYASEAKFKVGGKVKATVVPFASMPEKVRQTQQSDEIEEVNLDIYFPVKIVSIKAFSNITNSIPYSHKNQKVNESECLILIDGNARVVRQEQIRHDLGEINKLFTKQGGDWDKWYDSLTNVRSQYKKQYDAKAQRWIADSFFSAGYLDNGRFDNPEFIKSVVAFKNYLAARNVDLILVRVPTKGEIVDDLFTGAPPEQISNPYLLRMYKELLEADVEIITDIVPRAKEARLRYPLMYWYQNFSEIHPAEGISWVIAEEFAKRLSRYSRIKATQKKSYRLVETSPSTDDFKWPDGNPKFSNCDYVQFQSVRDDKGSVVELKQGLDSPILVLGSSFIAYPSLNKGGDIPHYLAYLTGIAPDIVYRSGADLSMPRSIAREGDDFLRSRSVCLFPFIPWATYGALASLPLFDTDKSTKNLVASYSGAAMQKVVEFPPENAKGALSYSPDNVLLIQPDKVSGLAGSLRIKLPDAVAEYPYFTLEMEFISREITTIKASFAEQTDLIFRSNTQSKNDDFFAFATKQGNNSMNVSFNNQYNFNTTVQIKTISFYGVKQPRYYNRKNGSDMNH